MQELLCRLFIKDRHNTQDPKVRLQYGNVASIIGVIVNLLVCFGELLVGFIIGSIAMISDGIHNVADAGGSMISYLSFKLAGKKPDEEHPYGHGRMEYLFSIVFSVILFVVASQLMLESWDHIRNPEVVAFSTTAIVVMVCVTSTKIWLSRFLRSMGDKIDSPILRANGLECMSDVWATIAITIGLLVGKFFHLAVDGYLGAFVSFMIAKAGWHVLMEATNRLLGNEPSPERVREVASFVESYDGVMGVHDLMIHDYGPGHEFASIHVEVDAKKDIIASHNMIDRIERDARRTLHMNLTIHMDPVIRDAKTVALQKRVERIVHAYNENYRIHDFRTVESDDKLNVIFDVVIPYGESKNAHAVQQALQNIIEAVDDSFVVKVHVEHSYTGGEVLGN